MIALAEPASAECPPLPSPPLERGVALGLFSADPAYSYEGLVDEVAALGATHLSLVWVWWQDNLRSVEIAPRRGASATEAQLRATASVARRRGLKLTLFPIVRLVHRGPKEWRGKIAPEDEDRWWRSYGAFIERSAHIAAEVGAERLSIGSELLTREEQRDRWSRLIDRLRVAHPSLELMYSANWDHHRPVRFWDLVDVVGLTAYWEVGGHPPAPDRVPALERAWSGPKAKLAELSADIGRPVVLTELGYPSLVGGTRYPWDETREAPVDLAEQRDGYLAAARALGGEPTIRGVFWWNWFGFGGPSDSQYTPRGKPAADVLRCWYGSGAHVEPQASGEQDRDETERVGEHDRSKR